MTLTVKELCRLLNADDTEICEHGEEILEVARNHPTAGYRELALMCLDSATLSPPLEKEFIEVLRSICDDQTCHEGLRETAREILLWGHYNKTAKEGPI